MIMTVCVCPTPQHIPIRFVYCTALAQGNELIFSSRLRLFSSLLLSYVI